jgi:hypothetical protein
MHYLKTLVDAQNGSTYTLPFIIIWKIKSTNKSITILIALEYTYNYPKLKPEVQLLKI